MLSQYENMPFIKALAQNIPDFIDILTPPPLEPLKRVKDKLGVHRLMLVEIIGSVVRILFPTLQEEIMRTRLLQHVLDLFFKYEWHNILHSVVLNLILYFIANSDKIKIKEYLRHMLCDLKLTE